MRCQQLYNTVTKQFHFPRLWQIFMNFPDFLLKIILPDFQVSGLIIYYFLIEGKDVKII